ncbi:MAG: asparagine synthase (glutamine-hydrolyzing), partial [Alphaproteobacteria bacterium]
MCGITGFLNFSDRYTASLAENATVMAQAIAHRGGDDSAIWIHKKHRVALAHQRLSILDPSKKAAQPMRSKDKRYTLTFNGMISNFKALRATLEKKGAAFSSTSDTEVLLHLIEKEGLPKAVRKLEGMFAFALWDDTKETLSLVRDAIGIKPLYYAEMKDIFLFGSEISALKKHPAFTKEIDPKSLALYLKYNFIPAPFSIYKNTRKLIAGTILTIDKAGKKRLTTYQKTPFPTTAQKNKKTTKEKLHQSLKKSVKDNLAADTPIGILLSGGIDSSLIAALAQKQQDITTFSIGFQEKSYDESKYATKIAAHLGTKHHSILFDPKRLPSLIEKAAQTYGEPFGDVSALPTIFLAEYVKKHGIKVALSGDGGDEVFLGYNRYIFGKKLERMPRFIRAILAKLIGFYPTAFWKAAEKASPKMPAQLEEKALKLQRFLKAKSVKDIYDSLLTHREEIKTINVLPTPKNTRLLSYLNTTDLTFYLP